MTLISIYITQMHKILRSLPHDWRCCHYHVVFQRSLILILLLRLGSAVSRKPLWRSGLARDRRLFPSEPRIRPCRKTARVGFDGDWLRVLLAINREAHRVLARLEPNRPAASSLALAICRGRQLRWPRSRRMTCISWRRSRWASAEAALHRNVERDAVHTRRGRGWRCGLLPVGLDIDQSFRNTSSHEVVDWSDIASATSGSY